MTRRKHHRHLKPWMRRYAAEAKAAARADRDPYAGARCPGCGARMVRVRERRTGQLSSRPEVPPWACLDCDRPSRNRLSSLTLFKSPFRDDWGVWYMWARFDRSDLRAHFRDKLFAKPAPRAAVDLAEAFKGL